MKPKTKSFIATMCAALSIGLINYNIPEGGVRGFLIGSVVALLEIAAFRYGFAQAVDEINEELRK